MEVNHWTVWWFIGENIAPCRHYFFCKCCFSTGYRITGSTFFSVLTSLSCAEKPSRGMWDHTAPVMNMRSVLHTASWCGLGLNVSVSSKDCASSVSQIWEYSAETALELLAKICHKLSCVTWWQLLQWLHRTIYDRFLQALYSEIWDICGF